MLCWRSLDLETYSKRALLQGEGGWGLKRPCVHWPPHPKHCQLGRDPPRAHLRNGTKLASGSSIRECETLLGKPSSAPMHVCSGKQRFLVSTLGLCLLWPRRFWADFCSLGTVALLVVAGAGNQLHMCSPLGRRRMGPEKALCALAPAPHIPPVMEGPT